VEEKIVNSDVTVLNISFWTGGCEKLSQGLAALSFGDATNTPFLSAVTIMQFFSEHQEDKMSQ